jgi:inner membrane protein
MPFQEKPLAFTLFKKTFSIGFLSILLLIPLFMLLGTISARTSNRDDAAREIARSYAGPQRITGPLVLVPYTEHYTRTELLDNGKKRTVDVSEEHTLIEYPKTLNTSATLNAEPRHLGIYAVNVYTSAQVAQGEFVWSDWKEFAKNHPNSVITWGQPMLVMGVSDLRGVLSAPKLTLDGKELSLASAPQNSVLASALGTALVMDIPRPGSSSPFTLNYELAGSGTLSWVPVGDDNTVKVQSAWPHPRFAGDFSPRERHVDEAGVQGFSATWKVSAIASKAQKQLAQNRGIVAQETFGQTKTADPHYVLEEFNVSLVDPIDIYLQTERAAKYGIVFVVLTFAAFFVIEMVKKWRIHPMQYLMVGLALVMFFLLLLSGSEKTSFGNAYLLASVACVGLITYYLSHVLGGLRSALGMTTLLTALYGVLYGILISEDNALAMGSALLFCALAAIMAITRKLDWYSVGTAATDAAAAPANPL